jgi:multidrug efflux pump subunit AcrB
MYSKLIQNNVLANLTFILVLIAGFFSYQNLPRQKDPTINFNWIIIATAFPGASASDVEKRITDPLENTIKGIPDMLFVSSNSRENTSTILVRFEDINERDYDKRLIDLRRELQNAESELPEEALDSNILEITTGNAFPAAMIALTSEADDERLRRQAKIAVDAIEQISGVDRVDSVALDDPELRISFIPEALESLRLTPGQLADSINVWFQDIAAGTANIGDQSWLVRIVGKDSDPTTVAQLPIPGLSGEIPLSRVATVQRARKKSSQEVRIDGKPAILLSVLKQDSTNVIELVERLNRWVDKQNKITTEMGIGVTMLDDQTLPTTQAISIMQNNAVIGLLLVLVVVWVFLGTHISLLTTIGIPFILSATFWVLAATGETLNIMVLLGIIIVLGMLVDDAVVVVEAIYYRMQRGMKSLQAVPEAMSEVALPVTTAVFTTIAVFSSLIFVPGILGKFMKVVPIVVSLALAISLIEAFWMLPSHVHGANLDFTKKSRIQRWRVAFIHWIQLKYSKLLIKALRWPKLTLLTIFITFITAIGALAAGMVKVDFFASDNLRIFYVNVAMPPSTPLDKTMQTTLKVEQKLKKHLLDSAQAKDARSVASYAGVMFTETEQLFGDQYGQIVVSLLPLETGSRKVEDIIESMREDVTSVVGASNISFLTLAGGPPTSKPISVKIRGDNYQTIEKARDVLMSILNEIKGIKDVSDDASPGRMELTLKMNHDAIRRAGINPIDITRTIRLLVDGEVVAEMQDQGEKLQIRVKAEQGINQDIGDFLNFRIPINHNGVTSSIPLNQLVTQERKVSLGNIRHYNFRRAITLEANIEQLKNKEDFMACRLRPALLGEERDYSICQLDTLTANKMMLSVWDKYKSQFPTIDLDFTGQLDDIKDSITSLIQLLLFGVGVMYLILGTQFRSYFQPFIILTTVPLAFTGVILGLLVTQNPLSLYTLYGVVALTGIAVNAAIVLISAANDRLKSGMSVIHAIIYASRRRVVPILITTLTTIAGLFSLATGLGGHSLIWGPVATAIVWGVGFSSILTLFAIPTIYLAGMRRKERKLQKKQDQQLQLSKKGGGAI